MNQHYEIIAQEMSLRVQQVSSVAALLEDGATVPFIARYRKEATGSLEDVTIAGVRDRIEKLAELDKRRQAIVSSLSERELLSEEINKKICQAKDLASLEDIYLPYRQKRRTKALIAKEKGLEPLARQIFAQNGKEVSAVIFIAPEKGCENEADALSGGRDIIAEWISEDAQARTRLRQLFARESMVQSKVVKKNEESGAKYKEDLYPEMQLPGVVTNVTRFGAFVDVGVHQDGLIHISQLADRFVKDPAEIVKVGQHLLVRVLEVDIPRRRIALSLKKASAVV